MRIDGGVDSIRGGLFTERSKKKFLDDKRQNFNKLGLLFHGDFMDLINPILL